MINNMADGVHKTKKSKKKVEEYPLASFETNSDRIDEVLQTAYLKSTLNDGKNDGKKKKSNKELLESLKKGEVLQKNEDDATLLANTYDPDSDPKNTKSNKQRQKQLKDVENPAFVDSENEINKSVKQKTKKKHKDPELIEDMPEAVKVLNSDLCQDEPVAPPRKSKKQRTSNRETITNQIPDQCEEMKEVAQMEIIDETKLEKPKVAKPKKKKKAKEKCDDGDVAAYAASLNKAETTEVATPVDSGQVLQVIVHRTDKLKADFYISHPLVRVHVIDLDTGDYLKKRQKNRPVSSRYETDNEQVDFILPIMTLPFDFKKNHSTLPVWEDHIVFNEDFDQFIKPEKNIMLIFELVDFVSMNAANKNYNDELQRGGWHHIAWAFLKLVGGNHHLNVGKKVRLQLYLPPTRFFSKQGHVEVFSWWSSNQRVTYPSTLYVTVKSIVINKDVEPSTRSMFPFQEERGRMGFDEMQSSIGDGLGKGTCTDTPRLRQSSPWLRATGQMCKIPNRLMCTLSGGIKGCFVVKFSHNGKYIACGCHERDTYPIFIYEITSGRLRSKLTGHCSIIYSICWTPDDHELMSGSGDGTARVWEGVLTSDSVKKMLPHPSFVYCASYHPYVHKIVVTGCYDRLIRVWSLQTDDLEAVLLQELDGHFSYVNSLCFDEDGTQMYSGDSLGKIIVWCVFVTEKPSSKGLLKEWTKRKEITDDDIKDSPINLLTLHPNGRRLLVHSRNNKLFLIDLRIESVMHKYIGALNFRELIRSRFTPCGTFVFAGSEDGQVYVWNTDSGDQVVVYSDLGYRTSVCDIDFHPYDNIVVFCSHGESQPIKLYRYDPHAAQKDITSELAEPFCPQRTSELPMATAQDHTLYRPDSTYTATAGDFNLTQRTRYERVMQKLQSIGQTSQASSTPFAPDFSPRYMTTASGGSDWRPGFTPIGGQSGSVRSSGKVSSRPQFMFSDEGKSKILYTGSSGLKHEIVVVLYDYLAQRSDELTLIRGEKVKVIYKDNENWWMGELNDGQQGFFPTNYVVSADSIEKEPKEKEQERQRKADSPDFESDAEPCYRKTTHAVVDKSGELKYVSATEDSDAEGSVNRQRKRKARKATNSVQMTVEAQIERPPNSGTRSARKKASSFAPT